MLKEEIDDDKNYFRDNMGWYIDGWTGPGNVFSFCMTAGDAIWTIR